MRTLRRGATVLNRRIAGVVLTTVVAAVLALPLCAEQPGNGHWVSAWSTAVHAPLPFPGLPPSPVFENQTVRMVVKPTIRGERIRVRFSNAFGNTALTLGSAHIALSSKGSAIVPDSDHGLTFGGRPSVTIPAGAPILSDPVDLKVLSFGEVAISVYLPQKTASSTVHFWAQHDS